MLITDKAIPADDRRQDRMSDLSRNDVDDDGAGTVAERAAGPAHSKTTMVGDAGIEPATYSV